MDTDKKEKQESPYFIRVYLCSSVDKFFP